MGGGGTQTFTWSTTRLCCFRVNEQLMFEILHTSAFRRNSLHPSISPWHRRRWGNLKLRSSSVSSQPTGTSTGKEIKFPVMQRGSSLTYTREWWSTWRRYWREIHESLDLYLFFVVEVKVIKRVEALIHPPLVSSHPTFDGDALGSRVHHKFLHVVELDLRRWCSLLTRGHTQTQKKD